MTHPAAQEASGQLDVSCRRAALAFVERTTRLQAPLLVPEVRLRLARDPLGIWQQTAALTSDADAGQPFWAFAWPGGQALARYLLDHPAEVRGRTVLDLGSGSAIAAIAAMKASAARVLAADTDPLAEAAARLNAEASRVAIATTAKDLLGSPPKVDLILIGDLVYERDLAVRVTRYLEAAAREGTRVLFADRATARRPPLDFELVADYQAPVTPALQEGFSERGRVWRLR